MSNEIQFEVTVKLIYSANPDYYNSSEPTALAKEIETELREEGDALFALLFGIPATIGVKPV